MKKRSIWAPLYLALVLLLMYLPILIVVLFSFNGNSSRNASIYFEGLSLQWYEGLFAPEKGFLGALLTSLRIARRATSITSALSGVASAHAPISASTKRSASTATWSMLARARPGHLTSCSTRHVVGSS